MSIGKYGQGTDTIYALDLEREDGWKMLKIKCQRSSACTACVHEEAVYIIGRSSMGMISIPLKTLMECINIYTDKDEAPEVDDAAKSAESDDAMKLQWSEIQGQWIHPGANEDNQEIYEEMKEIVADKEVKTELNDENIINQLNEAMKEDIKRLKQMVSEKTESERKYKKELMRSELERKAAVEENKMLREQLLMKEEELKSREEENSKPRIVVQKLTANQLNESNYKEWNCEQISEWMIQLDSERMGKYQNALLTKLSENEVEGTFLCEVDGVDLNNWGITDRKDRKYIMAAIHHLVSNNLNTEITATTTFM